LTNCPCSRCRELLIWGTADHVVPVAHGRAAAAWLPDGRLEDPQPSRTRPPRGASRARRHGRPRLPRDPAMNASTAAGGRSRCVAVAGECPVVRVHVRTGYGRRMMTTHNPVAVVTGASSGIGFELARQFAGHGFDLLITAEDDRIETAAQQLRVTGSMSRRSRRTCVTTTRWSSCTPRSPRRAVR